MEAAYSNRELDEKFKGLHSKLDLQTVTLTTIDQKVTYTNGKVRKLIIGLIGIGFFTLGLGFQQLAPVLKILLAL